MLQHDVSAVVETIRKLRKMQLSAAEVSSEAEALAFGAKIQELLVKHKLSRACVDGQSSQPRDMETCWVPHEKEAHSTYAGRKSSAYGFPRKNRRIRWTELLATMIGKANGCRIMIARGNSLAFTGYSADARVCVQTFLYLVALAERLAWVEYQQEYDACSRDGVPEAARGFRSAFLLGFVVRLGQRYEENMRVIETTEPGTAVVLARDAEKVREYTDSLSSKKAAPLATVVRHSDGFARGREVANSVKLRSEAEMITA